MESKKLGRFEVQSLIGKGAMGSVFKAFDPKLKRVVAIKTINLDRIDDEAVRREMFQRFNREAEICAALRHPNIAAIFDVGEFEDGPFLTMEFVQGKPLSKFIGAEERPDLELCCSILHDIASGLDYAHAQGVVHRDVKPSNVLISEDNQAIIVDFGIAKLGEHKMTKSGVYLGTPTYSSPEQIKGEQVDFRTDIFSFGVLAHELVTNRTPYPGDSVNSILFKIVHEPPQISPPLSLETYDESALKRVFEKVMHSDREQRYQSCTVFAGELIFGLKSESSQNAHLGIPAAVPSEAPTELMSATEARPTELVAQGGAAPDSAEAATELMAPDEIQPTEFVASGESVLPPSVQPDVQPPLIEDSGVVRQDEPKTNWIWMAVVALAASVVVVFVVWSQFLRTQATPDPVDPDDGGNGEIVQPHVAGDGSKEGKLESGADVGIPPMDTKDVEGKGYVDDKGDTREAIKDPPPVEKVEDLTDDIDYLKQSLVDFRNEVRTNKNFVQRADRMAQDIQELESKASTMPFRHQERRLESLEDEFKQLKDDYREAKKQAAEQIRKLMKD